MEIVTMDSCHGERCGSNDTADEFLGRIKKRLKTSATTSLIVLEEGNDDDKPSAELAHLVSEPDLQEEASAVVVEVEVVADGDGREEHPKQLQDTSALMNIDLELKGSDNLGHEIIFQAMDAEKLCMEKNNPLDSRTQILVNSKETKQAFLLPGKVSNSKNNVANDQVAPECTEIVNELSSSEMINDVNQAPQSLSPDGNHGINSRKSSLKMLTGAFYKPKKDKEKPLGQDAHFTNDSMLTIGVADGVGGFDKKCIDSGVYARELMEKAKLALSGQPRSGVDPMQVLHAAYFNTKAKGASTACIITLRDDFLHAVNLGDSGFLVIRDGSEVVYQSPAQQKGFNHPFQLGLASNTSYSPEDALEIKFPVREHDVVVAATDGLFDNLFPEDIAGVVKSNVESRGGMFPSPGTLAKIIGKMAVKLSRSKDRISPFSKAAVESGKVDKVFKSGKVDDVTVVVGYIYQEELAS